MEWPERAKWWSIKDHNWCGDEMSLLLRTLFFFPPTHWHESRPLFHAWSWVICEIQHVGNRATSIDPSSPDCTTNNSNIDRSLKTENNKNSNLWREIETRQEVTSLLLTILTMILRYEVSSSYPMRINGSLRNQEQRKKELVLQRSVSNIQLLCMIVSSHMQRQLQRWKI